MSCNFCGHVGPVDVSNDFGTSKFLQKPQQQQRKKKKPSNSEDLVNHLEQLSIEDKENSTSAPSSPGVVFDLGGDRKSKDPADAAEMFMQRSFQQIIKFEEQPHDLIFVPDAYLYPSKFIQKVFVNTEGIKAQSKIKQESLKKYENALIGYEFEEKVYWILRDVFKTSKAKNTVFINGWELFASKKEKGREHDFLIVCEPLRKFIHIEAKKSASSLEEAKTQLSKGFDYFKQTLPFAKDEGWIYVRMMFFEENFQNVCSACSEYVLDMNSDVKQWWGRESSEITEENGPSSCYLEMIKFLLGMMHYQNISVTGTDVINFTSENVDKMSTPDRIIFWTSIQKNLMGHDYKRVLFTSVYGTGKTILLRAKAKELSKKENEKVFFLLFTPEESMLTKSCIKEFKKTLVQVFCFKSSVSDQRKLLQLVKDNKRANYFLDEMPVKEFGIQTNFLAELSNLVGVEQFLWIACDSNKAPSKMDPELKSFYLPKMKEVLRYGREVLKTAEAIKECIKGTSFPPSDATIKAEHLLNSGLKTIFLGLKPSTPMACAVEQLASILEDLNTKTLIKIELDSDPILRALNESCLKERLILDDDIEEFLDDRSPQNIMVIRSKLDDYCQGFEVPCVVLFANFLDGLHNNKIISRCMAQLILVSNLDQARTLGMDKNQIIPVSDKMMPASFEKSCRENKFNEVHDFLTADRPVLVDVRNRKNETGALIAASHGGMEVLKELMEMKADLTVSDVKGKTCLHLATEQGHLDIVKLLVESEIDVTAKTFEGETALQLAIKKGFTDIALTLYEIHKVVTPHEVADEKGKTLLHLASEKGLKDMVEKMIKEGADIAQTVKAKKYGPNALHLAAIEGHYEIVELLLEKGAKIQGKSTNGDTALHLAAWNNHLPVVELLIKKGCWLQGVNFGKDTPLHRACRFGSFEVVKFLVQRMANFNKINKYGKTPLHKAAQHGHTDIVKFLVAKGANIDIKNYKGETALQLAQANGHTDIVQTIEESVSRSSTRNLYRGRY